MHRILCACLVLFAGSSAHAADPEPVTPATEPTEHREIVFDAGAGLQLQPQFPSSRKYELQPYPLFALRFLRVPVLGEVVDGKPSLLSVYPSFNFIGRRDDGDANYLQGTRDVDRAVELGLGGAIEYRFLRAFAEVRYGVTGHSGFVGEAGLDVTHTSLNNALTLRAGPRFSVASEDFMDTYFSVPQGAVLPAYQADAGFRDIGLAMTAEYAITEKVRVVGRAEYTHFVGDAADSPIVDAGNQDELRVGVGLTYRFGFDLY